MKRILYARRTLQLSVVLGFCLLPWLPELGIEHLSGSLFALKLGPVPFADPAATLQVLGTGNWPNARLLIGALLSLILAFVLGRVFCSWICPFGLLSELAQGLNRRLFKRTNTGKAKPYAHANAIKAAFLFLALLLFHLYTFPLVSYLSFPGELSLLPLFVWEHADFFTILAAAALPLLTLLLELFKGKRLWCIYICPQSVLLGLSARLLPNSFPGLRVTWNPRQCTCKGQSPCRDACSLGLTPRQKNGPGRHDCTHCADCVEACAAHGGKALSLSFRGSAQQNTRTLPRASTKKP